ncbi:armadillo-type protein [Cladochytrium replicatum]|nr:armadillo-type protein [Cladochytrium replicatum]
MSTQQIGREVLVAIDVMNGVDPLKRKEALDWLTRFQKTAEAWEIYSTLLREDSLQPSYRSFSAMQLRLKVVNDLHQLDGPARFGLRASIMDLIVKYKKGPLGLLDYLTKALAGLSVQLLEWENPVRELLQRYSSDLEMYPVLLNYVEFLAVELTSRNRAYKSMEPEVLEEREKQLLSDCSDDVIALMVYMSEHADEQSQWRVSILRCIEAMVPNDYIDITTLCQTPLIAFMFKSLEVEDDDDGDWASRGLSAVIKNSADLREEKQMAIVTALHPHLIQLGPVLNEYLASGEVERVKSIAIVYVETGFAYSNLILQEFGSFEQIFASLVDCTACDDYKVVEWVRDVWCKFAEDIDDIIKAANPSSHSSRRGRVLDHEDEAHEAEMLGRATERAAGAIATRQRLAVYYERLIELSAARMQFPADVDRMTSGEKDDFRDFRHVWGEIVKACVTALGTEVALKRPTEMLMAYLATVSSAGQLPDARGAVPGAPTWQAIEAVLFTFRVMGSEVPHNESVWMPRVMDLLPSLLPLHPRLRYAATLVIGRYTKWTKNHPQYIPYQLDYIFKGFEDKESMPAAALALCHLAEDAGQFLLQFLDQLHVFVPQLMNVLSVNEQIKIVEAVSLVIRHLPADQVDAHAYKLSEPIRGRVQQVLVRGCPAEEGERKAAAYELNDALEQFVMIFKHVTPPPRYEDSGAVVDITEFPITTLLNETVPIINWLMSTFGHTAVSRGLDTLLKFMIRNFPMQLWPFVRNFLVGGEGSNADTGDLGKLAEVYQATSLPEYLRIAFHLAKVYLRDWSNGNQELRSESAAIMSRLLDQLSVSTFSKLQTMDITSDDTQDIAKYYFYLLNAFVETPTLLCASQHLGTIFQCATACLQISEEYVACEAIKFLDRTLSLCRPPDTAPPSEEALMVAHVMSSMATGLGENIYIQIFRAFMGEFPLESGPVREASRVLIVVAEQQQGSSVWEKWVVDVLSGIPEVDLDSKRKQDFLTKFSSAVAANQASQLSALLSRTFAYYRDRNSTPSRPR